MQVSTLLEENENIILLTSFLLDFAKHREQGRFHAVAVEGVLSGLGLVQRLLSNVHDLLKNLANVLLSNLILATVVQVAGTVAHSVALAHQTAPMHHSVWVLHFTLK